MYWFAELLMTWEPCVLSSFGVCVESYLKLAYAKIKKNCVTESHKWKIQGQSFTEHDFPGFQAVQVPQVSLCHGWAFLKNGFVCRQDFPGISGYSLAALGTSSVSSKPRRSILSFLLISSLGLSHCIDVGNIPSKVKGTAMSSDIRKCELVLPNLNWQTFGREVPPEEECWCPNNRWPLPFS